MGEATRESMAVQATRQSMRELSLRRWGAQRPVKLARELSQRITELPAVERERLRQALEQFDGGAAA